MRKNVRLIVSAILLFVLVFMVYQFAFAKNRCCDICLYAPAYCSTDCTIEEEEAYCWQYWGCCCVYGCLNDPETLCDYYP